MMTKARAECGTTAGYVSHYYHGEKPCDSCKRAQADYKRAWHQRRKNAADG